MHPPHDIMTGMSYVHKRLFCSLALVTCASCTALPSEHQTLFNQELHVPWEQYMSTWNSFSANTVRELALWTHEWPSKCCQCHVVLTRPPAPEYVLIMHFGHRWENASVSAYLTKCGLAVTLIFDLLTSKLNQFMFVPNSAEVVNIVKFPRMVLKISC